MIGIRELRFDRLDFELVREILHLLIDEVGKYHQIPRQDIIELMKARGFGHNKVDKTLKVLAKCFVICCFRETSIFSRIHEGKRYGRSCVKYKYSERGLSLNELLKKCCRGYGYRKPTLNAYRRQIACEKSGQVRRGGNEKNSLKTNSKRVNGE